MQLTKLIVFDLDFCIWKPEMYQLQGPPQLKNLRSLQVKPKRNQRKNKSMQTTSSLPNNPNTNQKGMILTDRTGTPITVFEGASLALSEINQWKRDESIGYEIRVAIASCTNEPAWARKCLSHLVVDDGSTLSSCFDHIEIRPGDKRNHFESLQRITNVNYQDMTFFDDYDLNIENVQTLGVNCYHTPYGMSSDIWDEAKQSFEFL